MSCIHDGVLRARLDSELVGGELAAVDQHLASCAACRIRLEMLNAEKQSTQGLLAALITGSEGLAVKPEVAYARFRQVARGNDTKSSWTAALFASRWRPVWGLAAGAAVIALLVSVNPVRSWAQRVLAMLRVQKIQVVTIDPGKPEVFQSTTKAGLLAGYPIRTVGRLGVPQSIEVNGETAFQMTVNRDRLETLLDEIGQE